VRGGRMVVSISPGSTRRSRQTSLAVTPEGKPL
jgi:hypothetical protein